VREERDRRVVWTGLTPEGETLVRSLHRDNDAYCRRALSKIAPSKRKTVLRNFEVLVQAFAHSEEDAT
jgi:DNA-binding MarR family transcriptional regulator